MRSQAHLSPWNQRSGRRGLAHTALSLGRAPFAAPSSAVRALEDGDLPPRPGPQPRTQHRLPLPPGGPQPAWDRGRHDCTVPAPGLPGHLCRQREAGRGGNSSEGPPGSLAHCKPRTRRGSRPASHPGRRFQRPWGRGDAAWPRPSAAWLAGSLISMKGQFFTVIRAVGTQKSPQSNGSCPREVPMGGKGFLFPFLIYKNLVNS